MEWSNKHSTAVLNGCGFDSSILTYWFVNGVLDFSTAVILGTVATPGGLRARLFAYLLAVPVFLSLRTGYHLAHPAYREKVLKGTRPQTQPFNLDWFTIGIMMTGLPLAFRDLGPWLGMNAVFVLGIFVLPRFVTDDSLSHGIKLASIALGTMLFLYANYGAPLADHVAFVPSPSSILGPIVTLTLPATILTFSLRVTNSIIFGPFVVTAVGFLMNRIMTHPEVSEIPLLRHAIPKRECWRTVAASSMTGTLYYLIFIAGLTGHLILVP